VAESNGIAPWVPLAFGLAGTIVGASATLVAEALRSRTARSQALADVQRGWTLELQDAVEELRAATARTHIEDPNHVDNERALTLGTRNNEVMKIAARVPDRKVRILAGEISEKSWEISRLAIVEEETGQAFVDLHELVRLFHERVGEVLNP
jgi:hypothetical protein